MTHSLRIATQARKAYFAGPISLEEAIHHACLLGFFGLEAFT